jgi:hypothetical protein
MASCARIVRATEHKRVDVLCEDRSKIAVDDLVGDGIVEHSFLDQRNQERTRNTEDLRSRIEGMDGALVGPAGDCGARTDDANTPVSRGTKRGFRSGLDDTLDRNFEKFTHPRRSQGGGSVAGDNYDLGLLGKKKSTHLDAVAFHGFSTLPPVRHARRIADVKNRLGGQQSLESCRYCESANAGIEDANRVKAGVARCIGFHENSASIQLAAGMSIASWTLRGLQSRARERLVEHLAHQVETRVRPTPPTTWMTLIRLPQSTARLLEQKGRSISDELLVHLSPLG